MSVVPDLLVCAGFVGSAGCYKRPLKAATVSPYV